MSNSEKIRINVSLGGKQMAMSIKPSDEEVIRIAAKMAEDYFRKYRENYDSSLQDADILRMVLLAISRKNVELLRTKGDVSFTRDISEVVDWLEEYLEKQ